VLVGLVATFSRQTIFPLAIVLLAVLFREAHSKWVYAVVAIAAVVGLLLVPEYYWYRVSSIGQLLEGTSDDFSLAIRFKAFKVAWHLFLEHPWTGVGLNNFIVRSAPELHVAIGAHNGYLEILTGVGIFGFIAFILMPVSAIRGFLRALKTPWPDDRRWMKDLSYYFLLSAIAVFVAIFFEQNQFYRVFWVPIAAGLVARRLADEATPPARNPET
jgi:putative inorganic carbon (HCO3(-)) transporter